MTPRKPSERHGHALPLLLNEEQPVEPADALRQELGEDAIIVGIDEVGRGPLAGPVIAAAVVLAPEHPIPGLQDSKKLTERKRELLFSQIYERAWSVGIGVCEAPAIDASNILRASLDAMAQAFHACEVQLGRRIDGAVVDGNQRAPLPERVCQQTVVRGDSRSPAIMAASIIAKVTRDRRMVTEALRFPGYGFEQHKGYPTPAHQNALLRLGPCALHRQSFAPVQRALLARAKES